MNWYLKALQQYSDFYGRSRRTEYWMFTLFNIIFAFVAAIADHLLGTTFPYSGIGLIYCLYAVITFIPGLALAVRRLHDTGRSGWMFFIILIPLLGSIWLLVLFATDSEVGENEYGENPKSINETSEITEKTLITDGYADRLIMIFFIFNFVSRIFWMSAPKLFDDFFRNKGYQYASAFFQILSIIVLIMLTFALKDKSKRQTMLVLSILFGMYALYELIQQMILFNAQEFNF